MKKFKFKDGSIITASTVEEAKVKHKVMAVKLSNEAKKKYRDDWGDIVEKDLTKLEEILETNNNLIYDEDGKIGIKIPRFKTKDEALEESVNEVVPTFIGVLDDTVGKCLTLFFWQNKSSVILDWTKPNTEKKVKLLFNDAVKKVIEKLTSASDYYKKVIEAYNKALV